MTARLPALVGGKVCGSSTSLLPTIGHIVTHHVIAYAIREIREIVETDHVLLAHAIGAGHANKAGTLME